MTVDETTLENVGAMVTGTGGHMVSLSAKVRRTLGKDIGDKVTVTVTKRSGHWRSSGDSSGIRLRLLAATRAVRACGRSLSMTEESVDVG